METECCKSQLPRLTLVLGGARSGKSAFAEKLAQIAGAPLGYIATAQAFDSEMEIRISAHRQSRGTGWLTVEEPLHLHQAVARFTPDHVVVIDCLTLWLSNLMHAELDVSRATNALMDQAQNNGPRLICVSNELGLGLVPETPLGRAFRDAQGRLNQQVAAQAGLAVFVAAGLPLVLKGALPS